MSDKHEYTREEYTLNQLEAFKQVTHEGIITGIMYRVSNESSLADFLWQNQGYFQQSNVTKEMIENNPDKFRVFVYEESSYE